MKRIFPFLLPFFLIIFACSLLKLDRDRDYELLLKENLEKWRSFRIDGIIEVNYKNYAFRKNIAVRKKESIGRIDIYDTGLFGLRPSPFISIFVDSMITIDLPENPNPVVVQTEEISRNQPSLHYLMHLNDLFQFKTMIIKDHKINLDQLIFEFSTEMELIMIKDKDTEDQIAFSYQDELIGMKFFNRGQEFAKIQIDKISYNNIKINRIK